MEAKNLAVMFTDIRGFTAETSKRSRESINSLLEKHERLTKNAVAGYGGRVIKNLGDGFLLVFESPTNAILCGQELLRALAEENENSLDPDRFEIKIAIASGDVIVKGNDVFGEPVNTAARVLSLVEAGEIYLTQSVFLAMNRNEIQIAEIGDREFKGIPHPVKVYKVGGEVAKKVLHLNPVKNITFSKPLKVGLALAGLVMFMAGGALAYFKGGGAWPLSGSEGEVAGIETEAEPTESSSASPTPTSAPVFYNKGSTTTATPSTRSLPANGQVQGAASSAPSGSSGSSSSSSGSVSTSAPAATSTPASTSTPSPTNGPGPVSPTGNPTSAPTSTPDPSCILPNGKIKHNCP